MYLERFLGRAAGLRLQFALLKVTDELIALLVAIVQQVLLGLEQSSAGRDVTDTDAEAAITW